MSFVLLLLCFLLSVGWAGKLFLLRRFHLGHKLGGFLVELLDARFAAQVNVSTFVGDFDGLAHLAEVFVGDDALFQWVGGGYAGVFGIGGGDEASTEDGGEDECFGQRFHLMDFVRVGCFRRQTPAFTTSNALHSQNPFDSTK